MAASIQSGSARSHRGGDLLVVALGASVLMWAVTYVGLSPAVALGASVLMWVVTYVGLSPAVNAPAVLIAAFVSACLIASGFYIGRTTTRGLSGGIKVGLLLGFINFLIVASLHGRETTEEALRFGAKWIVGFTLVAVILGALGAYVGARVRSRIGRSGRLCQHGSAHREVDWTSRLAVVVAVALLPLLVSGGIVTGLDAGLAVPDWLTTFGYPMMFYPLAAMQENPGVYAEHFHRLWGMLVGLSVMLLAVQIHRVDRRLWLRGLSIAIILAVIVQGVLGAAWVLDTQVRTFAVLHGVFGQFVFATVVATAAFASAAWLRHAPDSVVPESRDSHDDECNSKRGLPPRGSVKQTSSIDVQASIALFILLLVQLAFGATYRHMRREAVDATAGVHALWAHIILATILIGVIIFVAGRAWGVHCHKPVLPRAGKAMLHLLLVQIALGVAALIVAMKRGTSPDPFMWEIVITTAHQAVGAMMLATAGLLVVWSWRLLRPSSCAKPQAAAMLTP